MSDELNQIRAQLNPALGQVAVQLLLLLLERILRGRVREAGFDGAILARNAADAVPMTDDEMERLTLLVEEALGELPPAP